MKRWTMFTAVLMMAFLLCCPVFAQEEPAAENAVEITLSDDGVLVNGLLAGTDEQNAVYTANDIVYYEAGKDFTYGEGSEADAHSAQDAAAHTVVHITQPGTYLLSGTLSKGQLAVDLGEDAEEDPNAVVTLVLNGVDITCDVAPAVIFYQVYECADKDAETASKDVDTSAAGANVIIADGTVNTIRGSYVARIYKPGSVVLSEDQTAVEEAKKLHKYDGAFYSKMSMNVDGGAENTGILNIYAQNEGLDSELHLTINGGMLNIFSGNDGINTNEDEVSVTTINGGMLTITVTGDTGEGDGIDSNGWLVINGGTVIAAACSDSADAGIDSDMGIHINGGTVIATGHMLDQIEQGGQNYAVFSFAQRQSGACTAEIRSQTGETLMERCIENDFSVMIYSSPEFVPGTYTLWINGVQMAGQSGGMMGRMGNRGMNPGGMTPPEFMENRERLEGEPPADGFGFPNGNSAPDGQEPSQQGDFQKPDMPFGGPRDQNGMPNGMPSGMPDGMAQEVSPDFQISDGGNLFANVTSAE